MKPVTKKVIEAGLVSKHTLMLMQRWGYLDSEAVEIPDTGPLQQTAVDLRSGFTKFVEELDELIASEEEEGIKETSFSVTLNSPTLIIWRRAFMGEEFWAPPMLIFKDDFGHYIVPVPNSEPLVGDRFRLKTTTDVLLWYEVISCIPLWSGDDIVAYQMDVKERSDASLPKL